MDKKADQVMLNRSIWILAATWFVALPILHCVCLGGDIKVDATEFRRSVAIGAPEATFRIGRAEFVLKRIPAGEYDMGSPVTDEMAKRGEKPLHHVRISRPFYIGRTLVTQIQYREIMGHHLTMFRGDLLPVDAVHYSDALKFCEKLSELVGLKITLPTEAQWEYACRAGSRSRFVLGDKEMDLDKISWYEKNSNEMTHEVGKKEPNAFGLFDMLGNVWQPCLDNLLDYKDIAAVDPVGRVESASGVMRGGFWHSSAVDCRAARRMLSNDMFTGMGIRIALGGDENSANEDKKDERENRK